MRAFLGLSSSRSSRSGAPSSSASGSGSQGRAPLAAWISIDPRTGELSPYPEPAVRRLEQAYHSRRDQQVKLSGLGLGAVYETLIVDFGGPGELPIQRRVGGGKRDVRRFELAPGDPPQIRVHVVRDRGWRIADVVVPGVTQERIVSLDSSSGPAPAPPPLLPPPPEFLSTYRKPTPEELEERAAAIAQNDREELVGLWEWCRDAETQHPGSLGPEKWAAYSADHNHEIETAFRSGELQADIVIGIRSYEVLFEGSTMHGKQVDKKHKKRRFVRRRAVPVEEKEAALQSGEAAVATAVAQDPSLAEKECVICAESFADTYAMPVVRLRECGHIFHGACVQDLADRKKTCPFCRAEVNWRNVEEVLMFAGDSNIQAAYEPPLPPPPPPLPPGVESI